MTSNILRGLFAALFFLAPASAWAALGHSVVVPLIAEVATISGPVGKESYGRSVAIEADLLVVGAPSFNTLGGEDSVFVYRRVGDEINLEQTIRYGEVPGSVADLPPVLPGRFPRSAKFGDIVALDGNTLFVGANSHFFGGVQEVYVFERDAGGDFAYRQTLRHPTPPVSQPTSGSATPNFGAHLAADAGTLVVSSGDGARVYTSTTGRFELTSQLASAGVVAIDGDTIVAGTSIFVRSGAVWQPRGSVVIPPTAFSCASVALDGDLLVYGCAGNTESPSNAWLFERNGNGFGTAQPLTAPGAPTEGPFEKFGRNVAISGDTLAVASGRALWLFQDDGAGWRDVRRLDDFFGGVGFEGTALVEAHDRLYSSPGISSTPPSGAGSITVYEESFTDESAVYDLVRQEIFVPDAVRGGRDPSSAAFRYQHLLYPTPAPGTEPAPDFAALDTLYTRADFDASVVAEDLVVEALRSFGEPRLVLGFGLLDTIHGRTVAAQLVAAQRLAEADEVRLGLTAPAPCNQGEVIDREICLNEQALLAYEWAIQGGIDPETAASGRGYFDLLQDDLGAPLVGGEPLGYAVFRQATPYLCVLPARYLDAVGDEQFVGERGCLYDIGPDFDNGYRDVVVAFGLLRDTSRTAARLAKLLVSKGDLERAAEVIADSQAMLLTLGEILLGVFPGLEAQLDANAGVVESIAAWRDGLTELTTLASLVRGGSNALAFDDDFLIFLPGLPEVGGVFDSYDRFAAYVEATPTRPLRAARIALNGDPTSGVVGAKDAYANYRNGQDELDAQLASLSTTVGNRLAEIVGAHPGSPFYQQAQDDPRVFGGSGEVAQQLLSLDAAVLVIERNKQEIGNLHAKVQIEVQRSAAAEATLIDFGDRQATLTEEIGHIEAGQAIAEATAESLTSLGSNPFQLIFGLGAGAANAAAQAALEELKAGKEARKERLAALERAELVGIDSDAQVRTWLLDMSLLAIDSQEAALLLRQETARLKALVNEKNRLETQLAEARSSLSRRYFADPIHRLRAEGDVRRALLTYERAQRWLYYMVRALEYKWNVDFRYVDARDGRVWTASSVFAARNADELDGLYQAMEEFDQDRVFTTFQPQLGVVSLRADLLGIATDEEFAAYLAGLPRDVFGDALVTFSTAREFPQAGLFLRSTTLDKIDRMVIALPGSHSRATDFGTLKYAGTSLVRTVNRPLPGPSSDRQPNELRSYSTRSWRSDLLSGDLVADDGLQVPTQLLLNGARPTTCSTPGIDWIESFKERSVATSGWELTIPARLLDRIDDVEIHLCHRWAQRGF